MGNESTVLVDHKPPAEAGGFWKFDLRPLVRFFYPKDPVTELLCERPIKLNSRKVGMVFKMLVQRFYEEGLRFHFSPANPGGIAIEITNACNLRCTMCNLVKMERAPRMMKMEVYHKLIDRCAEAKIESVRLHTYGETLMHPKLPEMLRYAKERGVKIWISTNAQLLDEEMGRAVLNAGVSCVRYSIEGATKETYESIRVRGSWETLIDNVRRFKSLRDELSPETTLGLNSVLMRETLPEISKIAEVFGPYVDDIEISALEGLGSQGASLSKGKWLEKIDLKKRLPCRLIWDMMNITVDGRATICCADVEASTEVGDALTQDLLTIWRGPALKALRELHRRRKFNKIPICSSCTYGVTNNATNRLRYALLNERQSFGLTGSVK